jgi:hypothetical protein
MEVRLLAPLQLEKLGSSRVLQRSTTWHCCSCSS